MDQVVLEKHFYIILYLQKLGYMEKLLADLTENNNTQQSQVYSPEFLRSLKIPDLPPGELKLKIGVPIILLRNLNPSEGLCNGTRLIVRDLQSKVIDAEIITGTHIGKRDFIISASITLL